MNSQARFNIMNKLYVICIDSSYVRDTQVIDFNCIPEEIRDDRDKAEEFATEHDGCWGDCFGPIFVDVVRAPSDEDAVEFISSLTGLDKRLLTSICISEE